ncbi:MAG TPA: methionine aminotransferase [Desulfobacterales bacterium]
MRLNSKLPRVGTTIFSVMTQLANQHKACNLSQGFPDFDVHPELIELVEKFMHSGCNQYAPMPGVDLLRTRISEKIAGIYGARTDPESEITVTSGATEALFAAVTAVVHPGDEVILFEPAYDAYQPIVELNGGRPVFLKLSYSDYGIDWDEVADTVTEKTRLIILNSPHNPTGRVLKETDISALTQIVSGGNFFILSDEVYEHIIFDGLRHHSMLRHPELAARSFVVSSFGKTYHATGWKIGYCVAPSEMTREIRRIHQFLTFASWTPVQHAYAEFLQQKSIYLTLCDFYQERRDRFRSLIAPSRFRPLPCEGTYFMMLDYSDISEAADVDFARQLTIEHGVAAIPPSAFYRGGDDHRVLRFCFAKKDDTLETAARILCRI